MLQDLSNRVVSLLRTFVPVVWGSAIAWLLSVAPWLPHQLTTFLTAQTDIIVVVAITGWYAAFRWLEPKLPPWLTCIVLGSNRTPVYAPTPVPSLTFPAGSPGANAALAQGPPAATLGIALSTTWNTGTHVAAPPVGVPPVGVPPAGLAAASPPVPTTPAPEVEPQPVDGNGVPIPTPEPATGPGSPTPPPASPLIS